MNWDGLNCHFLMIIDDCELLPLLRVSVITANQPHIYRYYLGGMMVIMVIADRLDGNSAHQKSHSETMRVKK